MISHLVEGGKTVVMAAPATDAAGRTGTYISVKDAKRVFLVAIVNQGNAAQVTLTPYQAQDVAATGEKVINAVPIWADLDTVTSDALVRQVNAANFTTDVGVKSKLVVFQVDAAALDVSNGFRCLTLKTGASNVANITALLAVLDGERYGQVTPPSALTS